MPYIIIIGEDGWMVKRKQIVCVCERERERERKIRMRKTYCTNTTTMDRECPGRGLSNALTFNLHERAIIHIPPSIFITALYILINSTYLDILHHKLCMQNYVAIPFF
jgi:hypothetical protein